MTKGRFAFALALLGAACSDGTSWDSVASNALELRTLGQEKLVSPSPLRGDRLGSAVAMAGNTLVLGKKAAAVIYTRTATGWTVQAEVPVPGARSVAVAGDNAIVGADQAFGGGADNYGAAFVFRRVGTSWELAQKLVPEDGPINSGFGFSLAIEGETLVVGGYASAFVFTRQNGLWGSRQRLPAPAEATSFGQAVAISGDSILVGSPALDNEGGPTAPAGAAYVFTRSGDSYALSATLISSDAAAESHFGQSVALSGTTALVGAYQAQGAPVMRGVVYSFVRSGTTFVAEGKLEATDGLSMEQFGSSVALLGDMALIGAPYHTHGNQNSNHGSAYLFMRTNGIWTEKEEVRAFDYQNNDFFGSAVFLSGASALIGSPNDDFPAGQAQGSAYLVGLSSEMGEACGAGSQCPSGFCSDGRCCDTACTGACDACSVAAGAVRDGECSLVAEGSPGSPACAPSVCSGTSNTCPAGDGSCNACVADTECAADEYCSASFICLPRKAQGRSCEATIEGDCHEEGCRVCASGTCVDGFCCDSACAGECSSCSSLLTGQPDGTCAPVLASADPEHRCEPNAGSGFVQVVAGADFTCGIRTDSRIACWGADYGGETKPPTGTFSMIALGTQHGCGIRTGGGIACWGRNSQGQAEPPQALATQVSTKNAHTCSLDPGGRARCWGLNNAGQAAPPDGTFTSLSAGSAHTCALRPDGSLTCWGAPQHSDPVGQYHSVVAKGWTTCALRSDNTIACWGSEIYPNATPPSGTFRTIDLGQVHGCGIRTDDTIDCWGAYPAQLRPTGTYKSLSTGHYHDCAIRTDDVVVCWGSNSHGELDPPG